jgi:hypothetical protein
MTTPFGSENPKLGQKIELVCVYHPPTSSLG